ncbi:MAG: hypothetical protein AAFV88_10835 [Planctomycetota bacterium]
MTSDPQVNSNHTQRIHDAYVEYNRTLRAWFVGFGVAAPVLIATQDKLFEAVAQSTFGRSIAICFFAGVLLQITNAIANKWMNWYRYEVSRGKPVHPAFMKPLSNWYRDAYFIHLAADVATGVLYTVSVVLLLLVLFPDAPPGAGK